MTKNDLKIAIIGNKQSGKSSLVKRITTNKFSKKNIKWDYEYDYIDETVKLFFSCINEYNNCVNLCYNVIVITIDLTSIDSFRRIPSWIEYVKNNSNINFIILVGTKCDDTNVIDHQKIINLCKNYENNNIKYIETSSKTGKNIKEFLDLIVNSAFLYKTNTIVLNPKNNSSFDSVCETYETSNLLQKRKKTLIAKIFEKIFPCIK